MEFKDQVFKIRKEMVINAERRKDYAYIEPSDLETIRKYRKPYNKIQCDVKTASYNKIFGAWMGRICGCMLGKLIEGVRSNELTRFLKETDNYPMHRYILKKDMKFFTSALAAMIIWIYNILFFRPFQYGQRRCIILTMKLQGGH